LFEQNARRRDVSNAWRLLSGSEQPLPDRESSFGNVDRYVLRPMRHSQRVSSRLLPWFSSSANQHTVSYFTEKGRQPFPALPNLRCHPLAVPMLPQRIETSVCSPHLLRQHLRRSTLGANITFLGLENTEEELCYIGLMYLSSMFAIQARFHRKEASRTNVFTNSDCCPSPD